MSTDLTLSFGTDISAVLDTKITRTDLINLIASEIEDELQAQFEAATEYRDKILIDLRKKIEIEEAKLNKDIKDEIVKVLARYKIKSKPSENYNVLSLSVHIAHHSEKGFVRLDSGHNGNIFCIDRLQFKTVRDGLIKKYFKEFKALENAEKDRREAKKKYQEFESNKNKVKNTVIKASLNNTPQGKKILTQVEAIKKAKTT